MPVSPIIFKNHFENTVSPFGWNGVNVSAGCAVAVDAKRPHHGAYNLLSTLGANLGANLSAVVYRGSLANAYRHLNVRVMNAIVDVLPEDNADDFNLMAFSAATGGIGYGGISNSGGTSYWFIIRRSGGLYSDVLSTLSPIANKTYCLELEILQSTAGNSDGFVKFYVDGNLAVSALNLDNDDLTLDYVTVGFSASVAPDLSAANFRCDCAEISKMYIGCEKFRMNLLSRGKKTRSDLVSTVRAGTRMGLH